MPQALGSLGGVFGGGALDVPTWMKLLLGGVTAGGEVGNVLADRQRGQLLDQEKKWSNLTPQQLSAKIAAATQPLSAGLTQSVGNTVQGEVAERGLAQSPGVFQSVLAQSLAPFYQQNQNTALNAILAQMGLPIQSGSLLPKPTDLSPLMALLLRSVANPNSSTSGGITPNPPGVIPGTVASTIPGMDTSTPPTFDTTTGLGA